MALVVFPLRLFSIDISTRKTSSCSPANPRHRCFHVFKNYQRLQLRKRNRLGLRGLLCTCRFTTYPAWPPTSSRKLRDGAIRKSGQQDHLLIFLQSCSKDSSIPSIFPTGPQSWSKLLVLYRDCIPGPGVVAVRFDVTHHFAHFPTLIRTATSYTSWKSFKPHSYCVSYLGTL